MDGKCGERLGRRGFVICTLLSFLFLSRDTSTSALGRGDGGKTSALPFFLLLGEQDIGSLVFLIGEE